MLLLEEWGTCLALGATLSLWLTARLCTSSCRFLLQIKHVLFNVCKEMKVLVETNLLSIKMWMGFFLIFRLIFHGSAVSSGWSTACAACSSGLSCWAECWTCILPLLPACWFSMSLIHQKVVCTRNWWMEWGFMGSHGEEIWCGRPMRQLKQPRQLFLFPMQTASGQFKPQQFAAFLN